MEHKSDKKADSKSKEFHRATDEAKMHYHLLVRFEPSHGAILEDISKYIGVPLEAIEKPRPGRYSYPNSLAYLTHIKYENKIQYTPEDVVTLAGTDYMDYYNQYKESWIKTRAIIAKEGGKPLKRLLREALAKMETGEIAYRELRGFREYRRLLLDPKYMKLLAKKGKCIEEVARLDKDALVEKIQKNEITSMDEITESEDWKLANKYHKVFIEMSFRIHMGMAIVK